MIRLLPVNMVRRWMSHKVRWILRMNRHEGWLLLLVWIVWGIWSTRILLRWVVLLLAVEVRISTNRVDDIV